MNEQAKPTHQHIIRLAPPLVITEEQIQQALGIIREALEELPNMNEKKEEEVFPVGGNNGHVDLDD